MECKHPYEDIDRHGLGECLLCGALRQYNQDGKTAPILVREGTPPTEGDPKLLPMDRKQKIAKVAKKHGIKKVCRKTGLNTILVRGWVGAYCRDLPKFRASLERSKQTRGPGVAPAFMAILDLDKRLTQPVRIRSVNPLISCSVCGYDIIGRRHDLILGPNTEMPLHEVCADGVKKVLDLLNVEWTMEDK